VILELLILSRNPTLEEQALARIHRIGQTQEVTTVRFYVRDSFEEVSCSRQGRTDSNYLIASYERARVEETARRYTACAARWRADG